MLFGCTTTKFVDTGIVKKEELLHKPQYKPQIATGIGAASGGIAGAAFGSFLSISCTIVTFGLCAPLTPALVLGTAGIGAGIGGGSGYIHDIHKQGLGLFQYIAQPTHSKETLKFKQFSKYHMPKGTPINIYKKTHHGHDSFYIKKI